MDSEAVGAHVLGDRGLIRNYPQESPANPNIATCLSPVHIRPDRMALLGDLELSSIVIMISFMRYGMIRWMLVFYRTPR